MMQSLLERISLLEKKDAMGVADSEAWVGLQKFFFAKIDSMAGKGGLKRVIKVEYTPFPSKVYVGSEFSVLFHLIPDTLHEIHTMRGIQYSRYHQVRDAVNKILADLLAMSERVFPFAKMQDYNRDKIVHLYYDERSAHRMIGSIPLPRYQMVFKIGKN